MTRITKVFLELILVMVAGSLVAQTQEARSPETVQTERGPIGSDIFRIKEIDVGDQFWGRNLLRVTVENVSDRTQPFWLHIGGEYQRTGRPRGFGMGMKKPILFEAHEERVVEHPYWIPPQSGDLSYTVRSIDAWFHLFL